MSTTTTTGTLAAGESKTFTLAPGGAVSLTLSPNVRVTITETPESVSGSGVGGNTTRVHEPQLPGTFAYGPYAMGGVVVVAVASNSGSSVAWTRKDTVVTTSSDGTSLVSGDGTPINLTPSGLWATRATLVAAGITSAFFTDVGVGGSFWFYAGGRWRPSAGRVVLKNLISSVTHSTTVRTVMDYATILAGLWQDGDIMEMEWCKTLTAGSESDTTETGLGTAPTTFGEAMNLTTAALNGATPILMVAAQWRWRRLGPTSVRPIGVTGSTGLGGAGSVVADPTITTNLDTTESYLQISGDLSAGLGPVSALRAFTVTLIAGA